MENIDFYKVSVSDLPQVKFVSNQIANTESATVWNLTLMGKIDEMMEMIKTIDVKQKEIDLSFCKVCTSVIVNNLGVDNFYLNKSITVLIKKDNNMYIAETVDLDIYGYGNDEKESINSLKLAIVDTYQDLIENEEVLSDHLKRQLVFLKGLIKYES